MALSICSCKTRALANRHDGHAIAGVYLKDGASTFAGVGWHEEDAQQCHNRCKLHLDRQQQPARSRNTSAMLYMAIMTCHATCLCFCNEHLLCLPWHNRLTRSTQPAHAHTQTRTHTHTHAQRHTHTHTHTHTHLHR
jgi:hypothetical protein